MSNMHYYSYEYDLPVIFFLDPLVSCHRGTAAHILCSGRHGLTLSTLAPLCRVIEIL